MTDMIYTFDKNEWEMKNWHREQTPRKWGEKGEEEDWNAMGGLR